MSVIELRDHPDHGTNPLTGHPAPTSGNRWQPNRAGLLNVWRYADEVLTFHRGRLLFRGPNGSGKSMALELLLPFLLDASARPGRLTSAVKSRGGLYERFMTGQSQGRRAGFVWVEFATTDRPGGEVLTCGVRLSASASTAGKVDLAWFTTDQQVGDDLHLLTDERVPLSRARLTEAIGDRGTVHRTADDYRAAVRTALFPGHSPQQYDAMILTLLTLRREKVSQDLSPQKLSEVLTAALPPLDDGELHQVAEGFEKLDRRRANLEQLESDIAYIDRLTKAQERYAQAVMASLANAVRAAESRRDDVTKREREAKAQAAAVEEQLAALAIELTAGEEREDVLGTEIATLHDSEAFRDGQELIRLAKDRDDQAERVTSLTAKVATAVEHHEEACRLAAEAETAVAAAESNLELACGDLRTIGESVGAGTVIAGIIDTADDAVGEVLGAWSASRRQQVRTVRNAVRSHDKSVGRRESAERQLETERGRLDEATTSRRLAVERRDEAIDAFVYELRGWLTTCVILDSPADPVADNRAGDESATTDRATELATAADSPHQVELLVSSWAADARSRFKVRASELEGRRGAIDDELSAADEERRRLVAGEVVEPDGPGWRSERSAVVGVPFWRLVDAQPSAAGALDGIEAALEAGGLLDALISPTGHVELTSEQADVFVVPTGGADAAGGLRSATAPGQLDTLASVLVVVEDAGVPVDVVQAVLDQITIADTVDAAVAPVNRAGGSGDGWVAALGRDGTFAVAGLRGRGWVGPARYLGTAAREQERRRLLAEVEQQLISLNSERTRLTEELSSIEADRRVVDAELADCPSGDPVLQATEELAAQARLTVDAERRTADAKTELTEREDEVRRLLRVLTQLASEHRLPTDESSLDDYESTLQRFDQTAAAFSRRARDRLTAQRQLERESKEVGLRLAAREAAGDDLTREEASQRQIETRLATLEATAGAAAAEVTRRLQRAERERRDLKQRRGELASSRSDLDQRVGGLRSQVESAGEEREAAERERTATHQDYRAAVADRLTADAGIEAEQNVSNLTAVLESARTAAAELQEADGSERGVANARDRVQEARMAAAQSVGGRVEITFAAGEQRWWILRATKDGMRRPVTDVGSALLHDLNSARMEFQEEERQLFDETLTGGVRREVARRIRQANELVDRINRQLMLVKTAAAGVQVRLKWEVDPEQPDAVREARTLLLRNEPRNDDREALHQFFRARIDQAEADEDFTATWEERLRRVLDYRVWHRFSFQIAHRDWEGYLPATSDRLRRLSTGERSMALHLPMLASVAAHYDGGDASVGCPRLVLLDELFAGVDVDNRDQLFSLFVTWDLDAVLTSDHEWCAYRSLDGIAIHHIDGGSADEPTTTTRFVWDGAARTIEPVE